MPIQNLTAVRKKARRQTGWKIFRINPNGTFAFPMYRSHFIRYSFDTIRITAPDTLIEWAGLESYRGGIHFFDDKQDALDQIELWWSLWLYGPVLLCEVEGPVHVRGIEDGTLVSVAKHIDILSKDVILDPRITAQ